MQIRYYLLLSVLALSGAGAWAADAAAVEKPKTNLWENSIALGLTVTKGNSDTLTATGTWLSLKKWEKNELRFGAEGTYGTTDGDKSAESAHVFGQYNRLFTERLYGYLRADFYHDGLADIDYRFVVSPGAGYYFIKSPSTRLSGEVGPGWVYEKKGGEEDNYFTIRFAERFEHKFNDRVRIWESLEYLPQVDDWGNFILNGEIGVETAMSKHLGLRVFFQDNYTSRPAAGKKENDLKLVAALAYKF
jgi:putative salt-induced outer membrane protein YdiY